MSNQLGISLLLWVLISIVAIPSAFAQSTSAAISGRITDPAGNPVAGATVEIVHVPSNSAKTETTDTDGRYTARGLRVGGPFKVTATKTGLKSATKESVSLALAEDTTINLQMESDTQTLETLNVVATAQSVFQPDNKGLSTNVTHEQIEAFPSIARSIQDYVRLDPRITQTDKERGEISAVGQNSRFNNISIDAVSTNDEFGLEANGLPSQAGTQPISIDTIEEFNISTANYDVTNARNVGASINAVTKSGTNDFHGSAYYIYRNHDWVGDNRNGQSFNAFGKQDTKGFTLGGPIVKDTLFFFLGYEEFQRTDIAPDVGIAGSGASTQTPLTQAQLDQILSIARDKYHIEPGTSSVNGFDNKDKKYLAKFDWNINENHRASFRYNRVESELPQLQNLSSTSISLSSNWYEKDYTFNNYVLNLYDDWSDNFSSETSISYSKYRNESPTFSLLPQVSISVATPQPNGTSPRTTVFFGTERSRMANELDVKNLTAFWAGTWHLDDHSLKFGFDYKKSDIFNLFLQDYFGNYQFNSIDDFAAGKYNQFLLQQPKNGDLNSIAADWSYKTWGLFVQDTWQVNTNLSTQFGFRIDTPDVGDKPSFNQKFFDVYGLRNDFTVDGNQAVQPRLSFNYTFDSARPTQLRGGMGLFTGASPAVWLSNSFTNTGLSAISYRSTTPPATGGFVDDPFHQPTTSGTSVQTVSLLDSDFHQPTVWKSNIGVDHELPWWGLIASADYLFLNVQDGVLFQNLNLGAPTGLLPDGRNNFWGNTDPSNFTNTSGAAANGAQARKNANSAFGDVILLRNTSLGTANSFTLALEKPFADDWYAKLAYTRGRSTEVNPGTSSVALSNWSNEQIFNPNEDVANTANYEVRDRITAAISWRHHFFENLATSVSAFYEGRAGRPYSYTFSNDANGDRISGNDLFYIPTGPGDVIINDATQAQAFWNYINSNDYLRTHKGQVAHRNAIRAPWLNNIDLRFSQQVPGFWGDAKGEITLDILNVLNLLNKNWGQIDEVRFPGNLGVAQFAGIDPATGKYIYRFPAQPAGFTTRDVTGESRWQIQIGLRYQF